MAVAAPDWLIAKPIAHRGLHDSSQQIVENTCAAAQAAISRGFSIECDVQLSADGAPVVFHDSTLERLTLGRGRVKDRSARELAAVSFRAGTAQIPTFAEFLSRVAGRAPVICEIKSDFDGDMRLADAILALSSDYAGPLALKSFDPSVIAHLRSRTGDPPRPLGIVAEARYDLAEWRSLTPAQKVECASFTHFERTRPDFLSFSVDDLPHPTPYLLRLLTRTPVMAWTVRAAVQIEKAARWADQIVFEGPLAL
jgi:glycerophosphoryl diester phosphodiesterase